MAQVSDTSRGAVCRMRSPPPLPPGTVHPWRRRLQPVPHGHREPQDARAHQLEAQRLTQGGRLVLPPLPCLAPGQPWWSRQTSAPPLSNDRLWGISDIVPHRGKNVTRFPAVIVKFVREEMPPYFTMGCEVACPWATETAALSQLRWDTLRVIPDARGDTPGVLLEDERLGFFDQILLRVSESDRQSVLTYVPMDILWREACPYDPVSLAP